MSICIFPGTFNPIHNAHLEMAEFALQYFGFEKIIFIPAYIPPHKELSSNLASHRYKMVEISFLKNPKFEVSDVEYKSDSPSYSLITVKKIIEKYNLKNRLNFIIGTDAFAKLETWYKIDELKKLVHFIVFPRRGDEPDYTCFKDKGFDFEVAPMKYIDISSTEIRQEKPDGETTKAVEDYIKENGLYIN